MISEILRVIGIFFGTPSKKHEPPIPPRPPPPKLCSPNIPFAIAAKSSFFIFLFPQMHQTFLDVLLPTSDAEFCGDDDGEDCEGVAPESAKS